MLKAKKNNMVLVVMLENYKAHQAGRIAGFPLQTARKMVQERKARFARISDIPHSRHEKVVAVEEADKPLIGKDQPVPQDQVTEEAEEGQKDPLDLIYEAIDAGDDWTKINGNTLKAIAKEVTDVPITNKDDAIAAIELALAEGEGEQDE